MLQLVFLLIFTIGALAGFVGLSRKIDPRLGGGVAFICFAVLTPSAFEVILYSNGTEQSVTMPAVGILCAGLALTSLIFTFSAATGRVSRTDSRFNSSQQQSQSNMQQ
jgi:metallophosphoesterase superfamily enzyme